MLSRIFSIGDAMSRSFRRTGDALVLVAAVLLFATVRGAGTAELQSVTVTVENKHYQMRSEAWFDASAEELFRVLTDYTLFKNFTSAIVESENVAPDKYGRPQFHTRMEACVIWWCKSLVRDGYLLLNPTSMVMAITDPEVSNFKYSVERWELKKDGNGTLMTYHFDMEPDFFVPPLIGPYFIKRALRSGGVDAINRIEALAQGKEPTM